MKRAILLFLISISITAWSQSAKKFFKQAKKDIEARNYKDAEFNLTEALRLKPNSFAYYLLRAQTRETLSKAQDALDDYMVCIAIKKHAKDLFMKAADLNIKLNKYEEAIKVL